jgi:AcrR family transcriptional regulator
LILDVAADLFARRGFAATTLLDVAHAADLKKASVYHYFPSKDALLLAVLEDGIDDLLSSATSAARTPDPVDRLDALLAVNLQNFERKLAHVIVFLLERRTLALDLADSPQARDYVAKRRAYDTLFVGCVRAGQRSGVFRRGDPTVLAYGILGMLNWLVQWYDPAGRLPMDRIGSTLRSCALAAVANPAP